MLGHMRIKQEGPGPTITSATGGNPMDSDPSRLPGDYVMDENMQVSQLDDSERMGNIVCGPALTDIPDQGMGRTTLDELSLIAGSHIKDTRTFHWVDSRGFNGWWSLEQIKTLTPAQVTTEGYLVWETETHIVVGQSISDDGEYCGLILIPKVALL